MLPMEGAMTTIRNDEKHSARPDQQPGHPGLRLLLSFWGELREEIPF